MVTHKCVCENGSWNSQSPAERIKRRWPLKGDMFIICLFVCICAPHCHLWLRINWFSIWGFGSVCRVFPAFQYFIELNVLQQPQGVGLCYCSQRIRLAFNLVTSFFRSPVKSLFAENVRMDVKPIIQDSSPGEKWMCEVTATTSLEMRWTLGFSLLGCLCHFQIIVCNTLLLFSQEQSL